MPDVLTAPCVPIDSRLLLAATYEESLRILEVEYRNGSVYRYYNIPTDVHYALYHEPSPGRFFDAYLRTHRVRCRKMK